MNTFMVYASVQTPVVKIFQLNITSFLFGVPILVNVISVTS
jgi:hypothetical protein